jgi:hypothetical protein
MVLFILLCVVRSVICCLLIHLFKFKFDYLNLNLIVFYCLRFKKIKKINFIPRPPIDTV